MELESRAYTAHCEFLRKQAVINSLNSKDLNFTRVVVDEPVFSASGHIVNLDSLNKLEAINLEPSNNSSAHSSLD